MDTENDVDLHDLETIEDNLRTDESPPHEGEDSARASANAFMIP